MESLADVVCSSGGSDTELVPCTGGDEDELAFALLLDPQKRGIEKTRFGKVSKCGAHPDLDSRSREILGKIVCSHMSHGLHIATQNAIDGCGHLISSPSRISREVQ